MSFSGRIRRLASETAVYGLATIVGRFVNWLLVPLHTNLLPPGDYGIIGILYSGIALLNGVYHLGLESAFFRFGSNLESQDKRVVFSTAAWTLALVGGLFSLGLAVWADTVARWLAIEGQGLVVRYAACILLLDTMCVVPFAYLRLERKPMAFALVRLCGVGVNVILNVVMMLGFGFGYEAIPLAGIAASGLTLLLLGSVYEARLRMTFSPGLLREMQRFGLPLMPSVMALTAVQVIDRPILAALTDEKTVGIYGANQRLGIFMMLVVAMFQYAWQPFYLQSAKDPDAPALFSRVLTYLVLVGSFVVLALSLFVDNLVRLSFFGKHLLGPDYWPGTRVVPPILVAYLLYGIYVIFTAGPSIRKKTGRVAGVTIVGLALNLAANYLLIPRFGMLGAAWAQLLGFGAMALGLQLVGRKLYPIPYEWSRLARIGLALGVAMALGLLGPDRIELKLGALLLLPLLLVLSGFLAPGEKQRLGELARSALGKAR